MTAITEDRASAGRGRRVYGETLRAAADGKTFRAGVFNENEVRAAAGLTLAVGAVAFAFAWFDGNYLPLRFVAAAFAVEFLIRVTLGFQFSPFGLFGRILTAREPARWVSAKPKRFAWTMGLVLTSAMVVLQAVGYRGLLPLSICVVCLTLMWLEAVLGLCLGCEIHRFLVGRGWIARDDAYEVCTHGACAITPPR